MLFQRQTKIKNENNNDNNNKQVRFQAHVDIREIPRQLDPSIKEQLFYSQYDFFIMRIEAERAAQTSLEGRRRKGRRGSIEAHNKIKPIPSSALKTAQFGYKPSLPRRKIMNTPNNLYARIA